MVVERLDNCRSLCLSTLARQTVTESEASHLGGDRGLFIYEVDESLGRLVCRYWQRPSRWRQPCD